MDLQELDLTKPRDLGKLHAEFEMKYRAGQSQAEQIAHMQLLAERALADITRAEHEPTSFNLALAEFSRCVLSRCD